MAALKVGVLLSLLERFADTLDENKANEAVRRRLRVLCDMFAESEKMTVVAFLKSARQASLPNTRRRPTISQVLPTLTSLHSLLGDTCKKDLIRALDSVLDVLGESKNVSIAAYVAAVHQHVASASRPGNNEGAGPMDERLLADYVKRLEAAKGDSIKFEPLYHDLRSDHRIGQQEAVLIATRFAGHTPPKTTRSKSLGRIRAIHDDLMEFKRPTSADRPAA